MPVKLCKTCGVGFPATSDGPENLVVACPNCNIKKGSKEPMQFLEAVI